MLIWIHILIYWLWLYRGSHLDFIVVFKDFLGSSGLYWAVNGQERGSREKVKAWRKWTETGNLTLDNLIKDYGLRCACSTNWATHAPDFILVTTFDRCFFIPVCSKSFQLTENTYIKYLLCDAAAIVKIFNIFIPSLLHKGNPPIKSYMVSAGL